MGWTAPRTYTVGEIITKVILDAHVRDNLRYLKGLDGVPTIESGLTIDNTDGDERLLLPLLSTAECSTVLNAEGEVAFDEQTHQMKEYDGTAVRVVLSSADVDDTPVNGADTVPVSSNWAYDFQQTLTAAGDIPYASDAGVWTKLAAGTALYYLRQNAAGTAPEWAEGLTASSSGTYAGNDTANRAIAHSLGAIPKLVMVWISTGGQKLEMNDIAPTIWQFESAASFTIGTAVTTMSTTNFYVGNAASYTYTANASAYTYQWVAIR